MDDIDYMRLAQALLQEEGFFKRFFSFIAKDIKAGGTLKSQLEEFFGKLRFDMGNTIQRDLEDWMKERIKAVENEFQQKMKANIRVYFSEYDTKWNDVFRNEARQVIEGLIKEKFANTQLTFSVNDLFGDGNDY